MNEPVLVGGPFEDDFYPFSLTRSVGDIRLGILTLRKKWKYYLKDKEDLVKELSIPANILPDKGIVGKLKQPQPAEALLDANKLCQVTDLLKLNGSEIVNDYACITRGRQSEAISGTNKIFGNPIFIEAGAVVEYCYLNASEGPIYVGKNATIMEGTMIRGPFALGEKSVVKMGARIYGATTIGPQCIVGGEIKNSIFFGYSNKAHDGYLGDSIIGEWCNLGAGTSNSNIKNSGGQVKIWNPLKKSFVDGGQKCGLWMGDYSRSAINTSFNTGTVVGACCHVFGNGLAPAYLPSFSWGFTQVYAFDKAIEHVGKWKQLKGTALDPAEIMQLKYIFDQQNQPA